MTYLNSARIYLMFRVAELARRNGLSPCDAEGELSVAFDSNGENGHEKLEFGSCPTDPEKERKFERMMDLLGCRETCEITTVDLGQMEEIVERAIDRSPRTRAL